MVTAKRKHAKKHVKKTSFTGASFTVSGKTRAGKKTPAKKKTPRPVLVIIHGAGNFPDDYYKPLVAAIEQRLGRPFDYVPVYYADVTNPPPGIAPMITQPESEAERCFKAEFQKQLEQAYAQLPPAQRATSLTAFGLPGGNAAADIVKEVTKYLFDPNIKQKIQQRLMDGLEKASAQHNEIVIAALSLGTVIAFETLKQSATQYKKIKLFFSCGCPLGKLRALGMFDSNLGAITPQTVAMWYNLYDKTDIIADAISASFPKPGYRIHDIFVEVANDPVNAHDYFNNAETIEMIANALR